MTVEDATVSLEAIHAEAVIPGAAIGAIDEVIIRYAYFCVYIVQAILLYRLCLNHYDVM